MIRAVSEIRENLVGAFQILGGRAEGLNRLDLSVEGFWRSFAAIILLLPFFVIGVLNQRMLALRLGEAPVPFSAGEFWASAAGLLADWFTFPLLFALAAKPLGLGDRYVSLIVARNWAAVSIAAIVAVIDLAAVLLPIPPLLVSFILLAVIVLAVRFSYVVTRIALRAPFGLAMPIALLDILLSFAIWRLIDPSRYAGG